MELLSRLKAYKEVYIFVLLGKTSVDKLLLEYMSNKLNSFIYSGYF